MAHVVLATHKKEGVDVTFIIDKILLPLNLGAYISSLIYLFKFDISGWHVAIKLKCHKNTMRLGDVFINS